VEPPFRITVYDKAFARKGWVGSPVSVTATPRHNRLPTASLTVDADHPRLPDLAEPGSRVVIDYDGEQLLSGLVRLRQGSIGPGSQVTFDVGGDWRVLQNVLGWPNPTGTVAQQGDDEAYYTVTGPAETVVKTLATVNKNRLGLSGLTVAPTQGRGQTVTVQVRMHPLADRLLPLIDQAGIGVSVQQVGTGLVLDCYTPALHPRTLTEASGIVTGGSWSRTPPTATRVVVMGPGEGTARKFRLVVDATAEALWGEKIEVARDARDVPDDANVQTALEARGQELLAESAAKSGLTVSLAETSTFRYGRAVKVGDRVRLEVAPGVEVEDVLREAVLSWTRDEGFRVTPLVGERSDDPDTALARAVAAVARAVRRLNSER
jgi:hypothetical protein